MIKTIIITLNLLYGADSSTTHYALQHKIAKEVLLPTQNAYIIMGITDSEAAASSYGISWLNKNEHSRAARIIGWSLIGVRGFVVTHNIMEIERMKRR